MTKKIYDWRGFDITSFFGRKNRSRCLQFTIDHEWIECSESEVKEIADAVNTWLLKG